MGFKNRISKLCSTYTWNEKQNTVKSKGCLSFLLPKIYQLPEYYMMLVRKILFLPNLGGGQLLPCPPISYAYDQEIVSDNGITWAICKICTLMHTHNHASITLLSFLHVPPWLCHGNHATFKRYDDHVFWQDGCHHGSLHLSDWCHSVHKLQCFHLTYGWFTSQQTWWIYEDSTTSKAWNRPTSKGMIHQTLKRVARWCPSSVVRSRKLCNINAKFHSLTGNCMHSIKWSREQWRQVTQKDERCDLVMFKHKNLDNGFR